MQNSENVEEWRLVPGMPHYLISNHGHAKSVKKDGHKGKVLIPTIMPRSSGGYAQVTMYKRLRLVHRLVLLAFVGPCPNGHQTAHLDGNPLNNHVSNLKWATPKENCSHRYLHGTHPTGERSATAKLTQKQVDEIRALHKIERQVDLAKRFGVARSTIQRIQSGERWPIA